MSEILFRGSMRLLDLLEFVGNFLLILLILAISPLILFMMAVMVVIGAVDYILMGKRL